MTKKTTPPHSSFLAPNSIMQGLVTTTEASLNKLDSFDMVTLLGLLALVDPQRPEAEACAKVSDILGVIEVGKAVAHAVDREWTTEAGEQRSKTYTARRFSPRHREMIDTTLRRLHDQKVVIRRQHAKTKRKEYRTVHLLDMYGYQYREDGRPLDVDDLPPGQKRVNVGSEERPVWKLPCKRPTGILFRFNKELARELAGAKGTIRFTIVARKIFPVLREFVKSPNRIRLLLLIVRQTSPTFKRRLRQAVGDLGWDLSHATRAMSEVSTTLERFKSLGIVVDFTVDEPGDRLEVTVNKQWHLQPSTTPPKQLAGAADAQTDKR